MSPFDTAHMTSYLPSVRTTVYVLSCIVFEILANSLSEIAIFLLCM